MEQETQHIKIAVVDDHTLYRSGLASIVNKFENCTVVFEAANGNDVIKFMNAGITPDIVLLDLNMPDMDGFETSQWLQEHYPDVHVLMVSMYDTEVTMLMLLQNGVKGFLKKEVTPTELKHAITNIMQTGFYHTNNSTGKLLGLFRKHQGSSTLMRRALTKIELEFLKYSCSEMTYKEIANEMNLNPRAIDNLRDNLFDKLDVKSRVGLAMFATKHCINKI